MQFNNKRVIKNWKKNEFYVAASSDFFLWRIARSQWTSFLSWDFQYLVHQVPVQYQPNTYLFQIQCNSSTSPVPIQYSINPVVEQYFPVPSSRTSEHIFVKYQYSFSTQVLFPVKGKKLVENSQIFKIGFYLTISTAVDFFTFLT